jgi:hypothetical protein
MSWVITGSEKTPVDPQFGSVSLLLHGDGANGSTTITDNSLNAVTVTRSGSAPPVISTAQSKFGGGSIFFNNPFSNAAWLDLPASTLFSFPSDFTFECWVYVLTRGAAFGSTVIETTGNFTNGLVLRGDSPQTSWSWTVGGTGIDGGSLTLNEWNHMAVSRSGSTVRVFKDGIQQNTGSNSTAINPTAGASRIAESILATIRQFNGYIDDLRITKGIARYTANFTPPTAPFPDI